jgi:hypothetical protein
MRKVILLILTFISIIALILQYGSDPLIKMMNLEPRAGLRVESNQKAKVYIDDKELGNTPYQNETLSQGEYKIALKKEDQATSSGEFSWQGFVRLNEGTLTVVNRELSDNRSASSGETITLDMGKGVTIVSTPSVAEIKVDGKDMGRTPISIPELEPGEHQFLISKANFLKRNIRATLVEGYNLTLTVDLAQDEADLSKISTEPTLKTSEVIIKQTPVGFLRVRAQANLNSDEIGRVNPGETHILLEELPNWNRIRLPDGKEGYVSSSYTEKKSQ